MASNSLEELKQDLKEYETLRKDAKRVRVQTTLDREIELIKREMMSMEQVAAKNLAAKTGNGVKVNQQKPVYTEHITNYAWDQSDKFMKLYLTLENLGNITEDDIVSNFTEKSVTIKVKFSNKISNLQIARLCEEIIPKDCYFKKKSEYVLVMLKKAESGKTWAFVTEKEKKKKDLDKPKMDEDPSDPGASITNLMKKMYDEGDDEMKRMIKKTMYESQMKQQQGGGDMGMDGMMGM